MLIPLTQGKFAQVDDADHDELMKHKWCAEACRGRGGRTTFYAARSLPKVEDGRRYIRMHTAITGYGMTDHVDGNGLNNQRANLRPASKAENARNSASQGGSSTFKGVSWYVRTCRWRAQIRVDGKAEHLGYFELEEDAARAYDVAARIHFGEYAALNFPGPGERSALTGEIAT